MASSAVQLVPTINAMSSIAYHPNVGSNAHSVRRNWLVFALAATVAAIGALFAAHAVVGGDSSRR